MSNGANGRKRRPRGGLFHWTSAHAAYPLLAALLGPALHLGGAPALSPAVWTTVALFALFMAGVEPRVLRKDTLVRAGFVVLGVMAVQLLPLPAGLVRALSADAAELHRASGLAWSGVAPALHPLHVDPGTGYTLLHGLVGCLAVYLTAHRMSARGHGERVYRVVCWTVLTVVLVTWLHRLGEAEQVYGFYQPRQASLGLLSPLLNPNHLAAFATVGTLLWLGSAAAELRPASRVMAQVAAVVCGALAVRTVSRGGVASLGVGLVTLLVALAMKRNERAAKGMQRLFVVTFAAGAVAAAGLYVASELLVAEFRGGDVSKLGMIARSLTLVPRWWLLGAGLGGVFVPMGALSRNGEGTTTDFVENLPMDLILGLGVLPALAVFALGFSGLYALRPRVRTVSATELAAWLAVLTALLHDMVDFSLFLAATGNLIAAVLGMLSGARARDVQEDRPSTRAPVLAFMVLSAAAGFVTARSPLYLGRLRARAAVLLGAAGEAEFASILPAHPADPYAHLAAASWALRNHDPGHRALRLLNRSLALAPAWAEPHVQLMDVFAASGRRGQALLEGRLAAERSETTVTRVADKVLQFAQSTDELLSAVPAGPRGIPLLRRLVELSMSDPPRRRRLYEAALERVPDDLGTLDALLTQLRGAGEFVPARALCVRLQRAHPRAAQGALCEAESRERAGELAEAEVVLRRGAGTVTEPRTVLQALGSLQARRGDTLAMRATMRQLLELSGADIDQRVLVLGQLGALEQSMSHSGAALTAFEQADTLAQPAHPYLANVVRIARGLGDLARVRSLCGTLSDEGAVVGDLIAVCDLRSRQDGRPEGVPELPVQAEP